MSDGKVLCGGSFLFENLVITAARCVFDKGAFIIKKPLKVIGATNDLVNPEDTKRAAKVRTIYIPKEFNSTAPHAFKPVKPGDIAILKLNQAFNFEVTNMHYLQAPIRSYEHERAIVTGYGWNWVDVRPDGNRTGGSDWKLRYAYTTILSPAECRTIIGTEVPDYVICARVDQRDPNRPEGVCRFDVGGPLVYDGNILVGVQSESPWGCSEVRKPGLYTNVKKYMNFIKLAFDDSTHHDSKLLWKDLPSN